MTRRFQELTSSFGHRSLLRLRRLPGRIIPLRPALARPVSTAQHEKSPLPAFILQPSQVASSSRLTLDAFFDPDRLFADTFEAQRQEDNLRSALSFAADEELMAAVAAPPVTGEVSHWIDPAAAYLGLRSSSLFSHYLQALIPRIRRIYSNLRPSGMHQLLVSDLLLRNPDPRALRSILQEDADLALPANYADKLRPGLVIQAYRHIAPALRRRVLPRLSRPALLTVSRALREQERGQNADLLADLFYELAHTTNWEPEGVWPLLEIALEMTKIGRSAEGLRLLQYPIQLGKLPVDAFGHISALHSHAATLLVQSTIVRTLLTWQFDERAIKAADDLLETITNTDPSDPALHLVLTTCRVASMSRDDESIAWAGRTLLQIATDDRFPSLSNSEIDAHMDALSTPKAVAFYTALPSRHSPPDPRHLMRISLARPTRELNRRIATDMARCHKDATSAIAGVLRALAGARMLPLVQAAYTAWGAREANLDSHTTVSLVRAFTRGARSSRNTAFARQVLDDYLQTGGRRVSAADAAVTAIHAYALIGHSDKAATQEPADDPAGLYIATLVRLCGVSGARDRLAALTYQYPLLAHRLDQVARLHGLDLPAGGLPLLAACAGRHWGAVAAAHGLHHDEEAYLGVLEVMRRNRVTATLKRFRDAVTEYPSSPGLIPTATAVLSRLSALQAWDAGLQVLRLSLSSPSEDIVEIASVFLSDLARESAGERLARLRKEAKDDEPTARRPIDHDAGDKIKPDTDKRAYDLEAAQASMEQAKEAWKVHGAGIERLVQTLEPTPRTLLSAMCERIVIE